MLFFIASVVSQVTIQPVTREFLVRPAWADYELNTMKPLAWSCKMSSVEGKKFDISGTFGKPILPRKSGEDYLRPVNLTSRKLLGLSGTGLATMGDASTLEGWHQFEVVTPSVTYEFEMDYIQPSMTGYLKVLSSNQRSGGGARIWKLHAVGLCSSNLLHEEGRRR